MKDFPFFCREKYYNNGVDWFSERFSDWSQQKVILHGFVHYLFLCDRTAERLHTFNPDLKLIVSLRNPIERAYSAYLQARKSGNETRTTFEEAIAQTASANSTSFSTLTNRSYIQHGFYSHQLKRFLQFFPQKQICIVLFDDLAADPVGTCQTIFSFLEVDSSFSPATVRKNDHGIIRSKLLQKIVRGGIGNSTLRNAIPINTRIRIRRFLNTVNIKTSSKPNFSSETKEIVYNLYKSEIVELEQLLGKDLSSWKI